MYTPSEMCGGLNAIDLYRIPPGSSSSSTTSTTSSGSSSSSSLTSSTVTTSTTSSSGSIVSSVSTSSSSSLTYAAGTVQTAAPYVFSGCYQDSVGSRQLAGPYNGSVGSVEACATYCLTYNAGGTNPQGQVYPKGPYAFFGVEYYSQCEF